MSCTEALAMLKSCGTTDLHVFLTILHLPIWAKSLTESHQLCVRQNSSNKSLEDGVVCAVHLSATAVCLPMLDNLTARCTSFACSCSVTDTLMHFLLRGHFRTGYYSSCCHKAIRQAIIFSSVGFFHYNHNLSAM